MSVPHPWDAGSSPVRSRRHISVGHRAKSPCNTGKSRSKIVKTGNSAEVEKTGFAFFAIV